MKKVIAWAGVLLLMLSIPAVVFTAAAEEGTYYLVEGIVTADGEGIIARVKPNPNPNPGGDAPTEINFKALRAINGDAAAWLCNPGTVIDYPVMKAADYSYYLTHLPDGTANANGALFIDYNNAPDFSGQLTVIYGHHMRSGKMFGSLKGYKTQSYYNGHPYMLLFTPQGNYRIELLYGCVIDAGQWRERAFMYEQNLPGLLSYAARHSTFRSNISYREGDRVIAMSTCSYEFDGARYVVLGVLREAI